MRESRTDENKKVVADPTAFTAVSVKHSGEEDSFAPPTNGAAKSYLEAAAKAFFGESALPPAITLAFHPSGAKAAVSTKGGNNSGEPKKKPELVRALVALPAFAGKDAELKKKSVEELKKLWSEAQQAPADSAPVDGAATDDSGTES